MGSPIVAGRIASPGSPSSLPYDVPTTYGSGNGVADKNRTRSITEASTSRGPVSKVMDMFRNRSQSVTSDDKRKVINLFKLTTIIGTFLTVRLYFPYLLLAKNAADRHHKQQ